MKSIDTLFSHANCVGSWFGKLLTLQKKKNLNEIKSASNPLYPVEFSSNLYDFTKAFVNSAVWMEIVRNIVEPPYTKIFLFLQERDRQNLHISEVSCTS